MKKVLITGTSRGLGKALAEGFVKRNYVVIATARNIADIQTEGVHQRLSLDVTKPGSIEAVLSQIEDVDILVNNAGISIMKPAEMISLDEARRIFDVNFFGTVRMMQSVIPRMRHMGSGTIVNISSCTSQFATLYGSFYSASKAALEIVSEELQFELKHFGIEVMVMQCGAIDTEIAMYHQTTGNSVYAKLNRQMAQRFEIYNALDNRPSARAVATEIIDTIEQKPHSFKNIIGKDAAYMLGLRKNMSDTEWEERSPLTKDIDW